MTVLLSFAVTVPASAQDKSGPPRIMTMHRKGAPSEQRQLSRPRERSTPATQTKTIIIDRANPPTNDPAHPVQGPPIDEVAGKLDIVFVRGQPVDHGRVERLTAGTLFFTTLSGEAVRFDRKDVTGIGFMLGQKGAPVKPPSDLKPNSDIVITYDGSIITGEVSVITEDRVVTSQTTLPRGEVDRIIFHKPAADGPPWGTPMHSPFNG